ncbi:MULTISPECIES: hypothetical protein [Streptomyces]|uniref:MmyB family transcriptional regulator n=1 Tax=Streptomyces TaxID=1883 RepID=UPI0021B03834|nr:hypothetical protein [Streptomyces sp. WAC05858]
MSVVAALLEASPEFAELWRSHEVDVTHHEDLKRYRHRELGELELYCQRLDDALDPDCCRRRGRHPGRTAHRARRLPRSRRPSSRGCPAQGRPRYPSCVGAPHPRTLRRCHPRPAALTPRAPRVLGRPAHVRNQRGHPPRKASRTSGSAIAPPKSSSLPEWPSRAGGPRLRIPSPCTHPCKYLASHVTDAAFHVASHMTSATRSTHPRRQQS